MPISCLGFGSQDLKNMNKDKDDYKVWFRGATISKLEANKIGIALIFAIFGVCISFFIFGVVNEGAVFIISFALVAVGYFGIVNRIFGNKQDK